MRTLLLIALLVGTLSGVPAVAQVNPYDAATEEQTRIMVKRAATQLLRQKNFAVLDRTVTEYRLGRNRTLSGIWLLSLFYDGLEIARPPGQALTDADWDNHIATLREWVKASPKSPAAHIALARGMKSLGWKHRGNGFAHSVTEEGWKSYHKHLKEAAAILDSAKSFAAVDPAWFNERISIALDLSAGGTVIDPLFKEAIAMEPGYLQLYFTVANRMVPKWGGNYHGLEAWARAVTDNVELAEGRSFYARIFWNIWELNPEFQFEYMQHSPEAWKRMKSGMRDINERYPQLWNTRMFLKFACRMRDESFFKEQWTQNSRQWSGPILLAYQDIPVDYVQYCTTVWNEDAERQSVHTGVRTDRKL